MWFGASRFPSLSLVYKIKAVIIATFWDRMGELVVIIQAKLLSSVLDPC